jgi:outer membrane protein OmpA-like peptidoglycan-associated protein
MKTLAPTFKESFVQIAVTKSLWFVVTLVAFAACNEDMTAEKATWETTHKAWMGRIEKMKKAHQELAAKAKGFSVPESEAALQLDKGLLDKAIGTAGTAIAEAEHEVLNVKTTIEGLIGQGKKAALKVALGPANATIDGALARAESLVSACGATLDTFSAKATAAKTAADAARARTAAWVNEMKKKGAARTIDLTFSADALDLEKSKDQLRDLVAALTSCAELKADLTVVALGDAADLGARRAEALKAYLLAGGVSPTSIARTTGSVVAKGDEKVTVVVTAPCK